MKPLVAADAAPKQDLDKAEAEAEYNRASIEKGKAAVAKAELDLKFTEIRAPITGTIGKEEVTAGNLVTKDKTLLTTLSSWDPMRAVLSLSESDYLSLVKKYPEGRADEPFELVMADNSIYPYKGKFSFVDRALDLTTGTLKVYVNFPNPDKLLRPGLFGRIRVVLEERPDALLAPQKAVTAYPSTFSPRTVSGSSLGEEARRAQRHPQCQHRPDAPRHRTLPSRRDETAPAGFPSKEHTADGS